MRDTRAEFVRLVALIANDGHAKQYPTIAQYRKALLDEAMILEGALRAPSPESSPHQEPSENGYGHGV